jgi:hypothetical protein
MSKIFTWSEFSFFHIKLSKPDMYLQSTKVRLRVGIWKLFIDIPLLESKNRSDDTHDYGFSIHHDQLWVHRGGKFPKSIRLPWYKVMVRSDILTTTGEVFVSNRYYNDKTWGHHVSWYDIKEPKFDRVHIHTRTKISEVFDIEHTTKFGEVQNRTVTLHGEEYETRWLCINHLPINKTIYRSCHIEFNDEIGVEAGSYNGGLMATSTEWKHGETLIQAYERWYVKWNGK